MPPLLVLPLGAHLFSLPLSLPACSLHFFPHLPTCPQTACLALSPPTRSVSLFHPSVSYSPHLSSPHPLISFPPAHPFPCLPSLPLSLTTGVHVGTGHSRGKELGRAEGASSKETIGAVWDVEPLPSSPYWVTLPQLPPFRTHSSPRTHSPLVSYPSCLLTSSLAPLPPISFPSLPICLFPYLVAPFLYPALLFPTCPIYLPLTNSPLPPHPPLSHSCPLLLPCLFLAHLPFLWLAHLPPASFTHPFVLSSLSHACLPTSFTHLFFSPASPSVDWILI